MLKIKDKIDLKELKKFGFIKEKGRYIIVSDKELSFTDKWGNLKKHLVYIVFKKTRKIQITNNFISYEDTINNNKFDILFDLIQAGMVEKVEGV